MKTYKPSGSCIWRHILFVINQITPTRPPAFFAFRMGNPPDFSMRSAERKGKLPGALRDREELIRQGLTTMSICVADAHRLIIVGKRAWGGCYNSDQSKALNRLRPVSK